MAEDLHRGEKSRIGRIDKPVLQVFFRRKCDRVQSKIKPAPFFPDRTEQGFELIRSQHVAGLEDFGLKFFRDRLDMVLGFFVEVALCQVRTEGPKALAQP